MIAFDCQLNLRFVIYKQNYGSTKIEIQFYPQEYITCGLSY